MLKVALIVLAMLPLEILAPASARAARVDFVVGTVESPPNLKQGDIVTPGTVIQSGSDGLIMMSQEWRSDEPSRKCISVAVFGYGQTYTVSEDATPGSCKTSVPITVPVPGEAVLSRGTRYADLKYDAPGAKLDPSLEEWRAFDRWVLETKKSSKSRGVMSPLVKGRAYLQGDYRSFSVNSAAECSAVCAREAPCKAMTFVISQRLCWLKNTVPQMASSTDMVSAVKSRP